MKKNSLFIFFVFHFVLLTSAYASLSIDFNLTGNNDLNKDVFYYHAKSIDYKTFFNPPINDICATAIPLTVGFQFEDNVIIGSNAGATNSTEGIPGCANYQGEDVWYSILVPSSGILTVEIKTQTGGIVDTGGALYSGACDSLVIFDCSDDESQEGAHPFIYIDDAALANQTIYFRVWSYGANEIGEFQVSAHTSLANDICANAEPIALGSMITGDTTGATNSGFAAGSCGASGETQDVWYSFVAPSTGEVYLDTNVDTVVIYNGCAGIEVACGANGSTIYGLTPSAIYYVRVYNSGTVGLVAGPFNLTISEATLSTRDLYKDSILTYYPNPIKNTLVLNAQNKISNIRVFNVLGQEVITIRANAITNELDMSNLQSGTYFVKITVANKIETIKVIKS